MRKIETILLAQNRQFLFRGPALYNHQDSSSFLHSGIITKVKRYCGRAQRSWRTWPVHQQSWRWAGHDSQSAYRYTVPLCCPYSLLLRARAWGKRVAFVWSACSGGPQGKLNSAIYKQSPTKSQQDGYSIDSQLPRRLTM